MKRSLGLFAILFLIAESIAAYFSASFGGTRDTYEIIIMDVFLYMAIICGVLSILYWKSQTLLSKIITIFIVLSIILTILSDLNIFSI